MNATALTSLPAWQNLQQHAAQLSATPLASVVLGDAQRLLACELKLEGLRLNYAFQRVTPETIAWLVQLAEQRDVEAWRARMWNGEKINSTEKRAALHIALRQSGDAPVLVDGHDVIPDIRATQKHMFDFADRLRTGAYLGHTGKPIRHVVNIGIGGSDLGPRMATQALSQLTGRPAVHFVANADAFELETVLRQCDPAETLFVVVSKTFTTLETLMNAKAAREWITAALGEAAAARHFAAVSTNLPAIRDFGIDPALTFPMWDWVGGRFSLWSAVGLSLCIAIGPDHFNRMLRGAEAMDRHFNTAPLAANLPVVLAMLGIWSRDFLGCAAHAVLPYSERLRDFPRYLQQLEMESNGKVIGRDGRRVDVPTTPLLFGEPGTVGQHGFHQWLHQGSDKISVDFIGAVEDDLGRPESHRALLTNMVAQAGAMAFGQHDAVAPQNTYEGNRGSSILMLKRLDAYHLGLLLALYEHKVFVQSVIWGINPFDQPGVELGKRLASSLTKGEAPFGPQSAFMTAFYKNISQ